MKKVLGYLKNVLSSGSDASSKRLVLLVTVITVILMGFLNMFFHLTITEFIFSGLITIIMTCLGAVAVENVGDKFGNKKSKDE